MEVSGQLHAPAALPPGKSPWYPQHDFNLIIISFGYWELFDGA